MSEEEVSHADVQQPSEVVDAEQTEGGGEPAHEPEAQAGGEGDGSSDGPVKRQYIPKERFDQVYARSKDAEVKLQQERETRARLEGELEAMKRTPAPAPTPRYTAAQLQQMIDDGKATIGQVLAYQEETLTSALETKLERKLAERLSASTKVSTLQQEITKYKQAVPEVTQEGTKERLDVEREYTYLVNLGYDASDPRTELMAVRAALGSVETIQERRKARAIPTQGRDTMQDVHASGGGKPAEKDVLKTMTAAQKQHYQRMIDHRVYAGWDEVREELREYAGRR